MGKDRSHVFSTKSGHFSHQPFLKILKCILNIQQPNTKEIKLAGIKGFVCRHYKKTLLKHVTVPRLSRSLHCSVSSPPSMAPSSSPLLASQTDEKYANVKWEELGFALTPTDYMYVAKCRQGESFTQGKIVPYGDISISPCSPILNYGQGLFEGLKAYRTEDDRIRLFRPDQNALRMQTGAERLCMTPPSLEQFIEAVKQTVLANKKWVPPPGKGAMYIRPLLLGSGATLGVAPAPEYSFLIYVSPVGDYHKVSSGLNLKVDHKHHRAHPGGTGGVKSCTNYSPIVKSLIEAKSSGFSDVLFLDAATARNIEEVSACNIFIVKGNIVSTPPTSGTILPGITRKSICELAGDIGYQVQERDVSVDELLEAEEVFCTGTAVVVKAVETVTFHDKKVRYRTGEAALSTKLHSMLTNIQMGVVEDKKGWMVEIDRCQG